MPTTLTMTGWIFMLVSCGTVTWVTYWCFKKVLTWKGDEPDLPPGLGP